MNKSKFIFFIFIYFITLTFSNAESNSDPLQNFLKDLKTLEANFVQILFNEDGEQIEKTEGVLYLQPPKNFSWNYQNPYLQKIISNGSILWIFDEDLEQVTIKDISDSIEQTPAGIILGNNSIKKYFVQVNMGDIDGFNWIELTPRNLDAQYKSIKMGFDKQNIGMMIIIDNLEQTTRIDFSSQKKNIALSSNIFNFKIPESIDVFDETK